MSRAAAERAIGLAFAYRHDPRAVEWLGRIDPAYADARMLGWRVSAAALHGRWDEAAGGIALMPEEERARERWRYWHARALEAAGRLEEARAGFESLAGERDYYGFLAADRLETGYSFNHRPLAVASDTVERVAAMPGTRRALELLALGRRVEARREWRALTRDLGEEDLKAASWIARCRDWHTRAILTIARTPELDDLDLRFPLVFRRTVESPSVRRSLPPAAVYAVIRQESAFMPDARSSAGALGLMQIMPRTGREIARAMGRRPPGRNQLLSPRLNVEMGTHYLRSLLRGVDGHVVLATASYNAGPHRVRGWLPAQGEVEAAVWIDQHPVHRDPPLRAAGPGLQRDLRAPPRAAAHPAERTDAAGAVPRRPVSEAAPAATRSAGASEIPDSADQAAAPAGKTPDIRVKPGIRLKRSVQRRIAG